MRRACVKTNKFTQRRDESYKTDESVVIVINTDSMGFTTTKWIEQIEFILILKHFNTMTFRLSSKQTTWLATKHAFHKT